VVDLRLSTRGRPFTFTFRKAAQRILRSIRLQLGYEHFLGVHLPRHSQLEIRHGRLQATQSRSSGV